MSSSHIHSILSIDALETYVAAFNRNDQELYRQHIPNQQAAAWMGESIPLFECPDKEIEEIYYFRWWTFRKHLKETPDGFVITEFLPPVPWAGKHNTISCAAAHHFREGRWLHDTRYLYDRTGQKYGWGKGLRLYCDGREVAARESLSPLAVDFTSCNNLRKEQS